MRLQLLSFFILIQQASINAQAIMEEYFGNSPEIIDLKSINKKVHYWNLSNSDFEEIQSKYSPKINEQLSDNENDITIFDVSGFYLVKEKRNFSLFRSLEDINLINENYKDNSSYNPLPDFNPLGKDFLKLTDYNNEELSRHIGFETDYTIKSLEDIDIFINNLADRSSFIEENRLILLAYFGNVLIKNKLKKYHWKMSKSNQSDLWEIYLYDDEKGKIEIFNWFFQYVNNRETQIIGLRGLYDVIVMGKISG